MRAIVIGFPKAGTTTIHRACRRSGLRSAHWKAGRRYCGRLIYQSFLAGDDPLAQLAEFDVIAQADVCKPGRANFWPNLDFSVLTAIRRHHPQCLFVLNRRDPRKIVDSLTHWNDFRARITRADIVGLPIGYGKEDAHLIRWIEAHYAACTAIFARDPYYLDLDIAAPDARERLSQKLGVALQWWGAANTRRHPSAA